ncbi:MAG: metal-dependent hydrolase [Gammaproteobacteria bacterium]|nr:metal-dependent hydrolase [Gammaproteobacteria bacterium]
MDSLTHIVVGAAVGTAVMGRRIGPRAALWGALCSTLPDLDVLVAHGDPVRDFTYHRAASHSLFWLTLAAPVIAWLLSRVERRADARLPRWIALVWLALISHPLLDAFTVYGTQMLLPFSDYPVALGSVFIIDPLYTGPLLIGTAVALWLLRREPARALRWNAAGLALGTAYLAWTVVAQSHVEGIVNRAVATTGWSRDRVLVTPTPFNSLLWRVVVMDDDGYREGYHSLLRDDEPIVLARHPSEPRLLDALRDDWSVRRLEWFSKGFYAVSEAPADLRVAKGSASTLGQLLGLVETAQATAGPEQERRSAVVMTDLRMGETPWFAFSFVVAERDGNRVSPVPALQLPMKRLPPDVVEQLWRRGLDGAAEIGPSRPRTGTAPAL